MSFTIKFPNLIPIKFIDSYQFMAESLNDLSKSLYIMGKNISDCYPITTKYIQNFDKTNKQIYPYEYVDSFEKFEQKEFPAHNIFITL